MSQYQADRIIELLVRISEQIEAIGVLAHQQALLPRLAPQVVHLDSESTPCAKWTWVCSAARRQNMATTSSSTAMATNHGRHALSSRTAIRLLPNVAIG